MAEDFERVQARLGNISSVKPILGAMRTISLGSWQSALKKQESLQAFEENFRNILALLIPKLPEKRVPKKSRLAVYERMLAQETGEEQPEKLILLVVGSERGLCGGFNNNIMSYAKDRFSHHLAQGTNVELWALGSRIIRMLERGETKLTWSRSMSTTALPAYSLAHELTSHWLNEYEAYRLDKVEVLFNRYKAPGIYTPTIKQMIPPKLTKKAKKRAKPVKGLWPPPIIETDPIGIYIKVIQQMTTMGFYQTLINSAAAEHAARFQLMEEAGQNSDRLVEEMTEILQMYRRQSITQEMQELAAGAGLLS